MLALNNIILTINFWLLTLTSNVTLTSGVKERKQRSQHIIEPDPSNNYKTKKNFIGSYTKVNPNF